MSISRIIISLCLACILVLSCATKAIAFCGFDVGAADANLCDRCGDTHPTLRVPLQGGDLHAEVARAHK